MDQDDANMVDSNSPPPSRSSTPSSKSRRSPLSLDLSSVPPLIHPSPPSNTLLITNLQDLLIFRHDHISTLRDVINQSSPIHSWSPLKSFRRVVVSFYDVDAALQIRQILDGEVIMGERVRVYFGEPTPIEPVDQHLQAPASQKLFFISPPPSPPHGWAMKNEEPPNKDVHADDLASALSKLHARPEPVSPVFDEERTNLGKRQRSGSATMIYHPEEHGSSPNLPAIAVEDLTGTPENLSPIEAPTTRLTHTSRPPVELMADT
ncbi:MAG: hypothetical protein M4579_001764 [Chaenotheca gracillima]|nr:MAG: hypothetical protein M4579_001764 [Chaenotheca gracillima]